MTLHAYDTPAALLLLGSGFLACFAGYRLFKVVLAIYGFILGAALANSTMGVSSTAPAIATAIVGGAAGALILVLAYFVGIALVGASLGALVAHVGWNYVNGSGDPPLALLVGLAVLGAIGAMLLQRYVIIVSTAFGGAWVILIAALALSGKSGLANSVASGDISILYPDRTGASDAWVPIAWIGLGLFGTIVQLGVTGRARR